MDELPFTWLVCGLPDRRKVLQRLFGLLRASHLLKLVERDIRGRLVVFFPGHKDNNNYRLLDARDGWNYLAVPITLHGDGGLE